MIPNCYAGCVHSGITSLSVKQRSAVCVCVCVRLSVTREYCNKMAARIELFFCVYGFNLSTYATLRFKEMKLSKKQKSNALWMLENLAARTPTVSECDKQRQRPVRCRQHLWRRR